MKYCILLLVSMLLFFSCEKEDLTISDLPAEDEVFQDIKIYKDNVILIQKKIVQDYLTAFDLEAHQFIFSGISSGELGYNVGDIIAFDEFLPTKPFAKGILHVIENIDEQGGELIINARPAKIPEAFERLKIYGTFSEEEGVSSPRDNESVKTKIGIFKLPDGDEYDEQDGFIKINVPGVSGNLFGKVGSKVAATFVIEWNDDGSQLLKIGFEKINTGFTSEFNLSPGEIFDPKSLKFPEKPKDLFKLNAISFPPPFNVVYANLKIQGQAFVKMRGGINIKLGGAQNVQMYSVYDNLEDEWNTVANVSNIGNDDVISDLTLGVGIENSLNIDGEAEAGANSIIHLGLYGGYAIPGLGGTGVGLTLSTTIGLSIKGFASITEPEKLECSLNLNVSPELKIGVDAPEDFFPEFTIATADFTYPILNLCEGEPECDKNAEVDMFTIECNEGVIQGVPDDDLLVAVFKITETTNRGVSFKMKINDEFVISNITNEPRIFNYNVENIISASYGIPFDVNLNVEIIDEFDEACKLPFNIFVDDPSSFCGRTCTPDDIVTGTANNYGVVRIYDQFWMNENLNESGGMCYDNNVNNCAQFGKLYSFYDLLDINLGEINNPLFNELIISDNKGKCPNGYHVPTIEEWSELIDGAGVNVGDVLKSNQSSNDGTPLWPSGSANNVFGFCALPAGYHFVKDKGSLDESDDDVIPEFINEKAIFWSSSPVPNKNGAFYSIEISDHNKTIVIKEDIPSQMYSCRCIKD